MPQYNYECECGEITSDIRKVVDRDFQQVCGGCGEMAERTFKSDNQVDAINQAGGKFEITLDHAERHPVNFTSRKQLRRYCDKRNLESGALL